MYKALKAVIFDMDGVLVTSEPLWRTAMINGFIENGMPFTEQDCRKTTGRRFNEVVAYWLNHHQSPSDPKHIETTITTQMLSLIKEQGEAIPGILEILDFCTRNKLKKGLATSSSHSLMETVLDKLNLNSAFHATVSAEYMKHGKPHPEVFLDCAEKLGMDPMECLVIEDSLNGVIAAKAAQMRVMAVPDEEHWNLAGFAVADFKCPDMTEALKVIESLYNKS